MIGCLIVDDEKGNREFLASLIEDYCTDVRVLGLAANMEQGIAMIREKKPELVFLDIKMPGGSGFDMLEKMRNDAHAFDVIFTTAYDQYAIKAFRYSALDYLLKPIHPMQLMESVKRKVEKNEKKRMLESLSHFKEMMEDNNREIKKIVLSGYTEEHLVEIKEIIRCEADRNYTHIYLTNGKKVIVGKSLKEFDELLSPLDFFRVHQSHLINLHHFAYYQKNEDAGGGQACLVDGTVVNVSRSRKKLLLEAIRVLGDLG